MEKIKTILDRKPVSSDYIKSKQDFGKVIKGVKALSPPVYKSAWFYGAVGVAAVAITVAAVTLTGSDAPHDKAQMDTSQIASNLPPEDTNAAPLVEKRESEQDRSETKQEVKKKIEVKSKPSEVLKTAENEPDIERLTVMKKVEEIVPNLDSDMPHISGISSGPIDFKDFCNPLGIQVDNGVLIYRYTIQYRSCARDVTANIRGNRIPQTLCDEIRDCGNPIEISFMNIEGQDRKGNNILLKDFTVVTTL